MFYHHPHCAVEACEQVSEEGSATWTIRGRQYSAARCFERLYGYYSAGDVRPMVERVSGYKLVNGGSDIFFLLAMLKEKHRRYIFPGRITQLDSLTPAFTTQNSVYYVKREVLKVLLEVSISDTDEHTFSCLTSSEKIVYQRLKTKNNKILRAGWPDFLVQDNNGRCRFIEVKRNARDPLHPSQIEMHKILAELGIIVEVMYADEGKRCFTNLPESDKVA